MALGRGLSSLIQPKEETGGKQNNQGFFSVPVDEIRPNTMQPRRDFDLAAMQDLADSIAENGILQPIVVSTIKNQKADGKNYQIIAGERRWRAAKMINLKEVPVVLREISGDEEGLELGILENIQRENLNPIELAMAYKRLNDLGLSYEQIGKKIGKSRPLINNTVRLLTLPMPIQEDLKTGALSENHGRAILALPTPELQIKLWGEVKEQKLSARNTEVASRKYKKVPSKSAANLNAFTKDIIVQLEAYLGTKVLVQPGKHVSDGGKIVIKYFSNEDLRNIVKKITKE